jgi:internalin A
MTADAAYKEAQKQIEKAKKDRATRLDLSGLGLKEVPPEIGQLSILRNLYLENNLLTSIPDALQSLTNLKTLLLHNNPELNLPESVLGEITADPDKAAKPADILAYYFATRQAARPLLEAKLILVGRGGVGKSSLVDRLVNNTFDPKKTQTDGIAITEWQVKLSRKETARLNIWDFGGQEIMHSTHQFFLTERSLYLVVLNGREGLGNEDAEYWLRLVSSFGKGAPAIVVLNKIKTTQIDMTLNTSTATSKALKWTSNCCRRSPISRFPTKSCGHLRKREKRRSPCSWAAM